MLSCEICSILFLYEDKHIGRFSYLHLCTFNGKFHFLCGHRIQRSGQDTRPLYLRCFRRSKLPLWDCQQETENSKQILKSVGIYVINIYSSTSALLIHIPLISSHKRLQRLFNFGALKCDVYWRQNRLLQSKSIDSHEILRLWYFFFPNNK